MRLEDERIARERAERARAVEAEAREKALVAERELEARLRAEREDFERRCTEERAAREEEARLTGIKQAIVERARVEAEAKAREALHAREMTRLAAPPVTHAEPAAAPERLLRSVALSLFAGIAATLLMSGSVYALALAPRAEAAEKLMEHRAEEAQRGRDEEHDKRVRAESTASELERRVRALEEEARNAKRAADAAAAGKGTTPGPSSSTWKPPIKKEPKGPCMNPHDPLCGDLDMK
jgi:hypothetical protein